MESWNNSTAKAGQTMKPLRLCSWEKVHSPSKRRAYITAWGFFLPIIIFYICKGESQLSATSCTSCFKAAILNIRNIYFPLPWILQNLFQMWSWNTGCTEVCISVCTNIRHYRTDVHVELQPAMTLFSTVRGYLVLPMPSPLLFQDSRYYIKYDAKKCFIPEF